MRAPYEGGSRVRGWCRPNALGWEEERLGARALGPRVPAGPAWLKAGTGVLPTTGAARPGSLFLCFVSLQIMIEFCPGGAVDAIMLGESSVIPCVCPVGPVQDWRPSLPTP